MFGIVVEAAEIVGRKGILVPCLHDERYAYMGIYRSMLEECGGILFNAKSEQRLANKLAQINGVQQFVLGVIVDTNPPIGNSEKFAKKYNISKPYLLYAGRRIEGKNVPELVEYFRAARMGGLLSHDVDLVLIGGGDLDYSGLDSEGIFQLGHIPLEDKYDAMAGALAMVQPSLNESFSIVIMESWLQGRPVMVAEQCEVTKDHCVDSGGGFPYKGVKDFASKVNLLADDSNLCSSFADRGRTYVLERYEDKIVVENFCKFLRNLLEAGHGNPRQVFRKKARQTLGRLLSKV